MVKATSLRRLPEILLLALMGALVRSATLALTGRPADARAVLWAWGWNVKELPVTIVHRRRLQRQRKVDDSALAPCVPRAVRRSEPSCASSSLSRPRPPAQGL